MTSLCGDSSVLSGFAAEFDIVLANINRNILLADMPPAEFDIVLANINRNILLADMPRFVSVMAPHSTLILSGFYESDCTLLESKAQQLGLKLIATKTDGDWACMVLKSL